MGIYVNPTGELKEEFLTREGVRVDHSFVWKDLPTNCLPVVLVKNGFFTAAGIAFSERELRQFLRPGDVRPKEIFIVEIGKLKTVSPLRDDDVGSPGAEINRLGENEHLDQDY